MISSPWPASMDRGADGHVSIGGVRVEDLLAEFGSPLLVMDETDFRARCRAYRHAFSGATVAYASKAWCTTGVIQIADEEGLWIDVVSGGELHAVLRAGVDPERIVFHGNNKSVSELEHAVVVGVARIVVDSVEELHRIEAIGVANAKPIACWLRITPGIDAHTHEYVRTGHDDSKFGFSVALGLADEAIEIALTLEHVDIVGVHAHIGSQIFGTDPFVANVDTLIELLARWKAGHDLTIAEMNIGGGMAIRYTHEDHPVGVQRYGDAVIAAVADACGRHHFPRPTLFVEPGRALVGPTTLTLYTVGTVKKLPGIRTFVSVDGGMSDNIRPALYKAEHEVIVVNRHGSETVVPMTVVGKHCESGDLVRERAPLPDDITAGDVLAVAATGAYTASMASNYNLLSRPAAVLVSDGAVRLLMRRESIDEILARDVSIR
ncbi:MAG: diaminopimelate decarboxylase [Acidobacteria bacterium]|nr:diaminopimelate decarboxylase [Acidobacteriota bacterium]